MTDNEIIKAAENCVSYAPDCDACPYTHIGESAPECMEALVEDLLSLINRQKAEIEELRNTNQCIQETTEKVVRYERMMAVAEFAERLKVKFIPALSFDEDLQKVVTVKDIDNLLAEMAGASQ